MDSISIIVFNWVLVLIILAFVALRMWVRLKVIKKPLTNGDILLIIVQALNFTAVGILTELMVLEMKRPELRFIGSSDDEWPSAWDEGARETLKLKFASFPVYYTILWFTKAVYISVYYGVFTHLHKSVKIILSCSSVYMVISYVITMLVYLLWCRPLSSAWESPMSPSFCYPQQEKVVFVIAFVCNISTDLILLSVSLALVRTLQFPRRDCWEVLFRCLIGIISIIASTSRFIILQDYANGHSGQRDKVIICTAVEVFCGEIAVCLPACRNFFAFLNSKNKLFTSKSSKKPENERSIRRDRRGEQSWLESGEFGSEIELGVQGNQA